VSTSAKQQVPQTDRRTVSVTRWSRVYRCRRPATVNSHCLPTSNSCSHCVCSSVAVVCRLLTYYKYKVRVHAGLNTHCTGVASVSLLSHTLSSHALAPCPAAQQPGHPLSRLVSSDQRDVLSLYFNALPRTTTKFSVVTHMDRGRVLAGQPHYCILQYNYCI